MEKSINSTPNVTSPKLMSKMASDGIKSTVEPSGSKKNTGFTPASISWSNVNVYGKPPRTFMDTMLCRPERMGTQIIKNVSGGVKAGSALAIMGASGAGKTTLLNVLTARNLGNFHVEGEIRINNRLANIDMITSMSAYVQQEDMFLPMLTVREHMVFQSLVRMESSIPEHMKCKRINQVMKDLGLTKCAETRVGGSRYFKGISGGELKRLSFAVEILTNPSILFCDEPTSGLDSFMAANLVSIINKLARAGHTIICTIHQPSSDTFDLFQNLLLLADGRVAYFGELRGALRFFSSIGLRCPANYNPADFYIRELAVIPGREHESKKRVNRICDYFEKNYGQNVSDARFRQSSFVQGGRKDSPSPYKVSRWQQYVALTWRAYLTVLREPSLTYIRLAQALINSVVIAVVFHDQNYDQHGTFNINGALFLLCINMTMQNAFAVINVFCSEMAIFKRENNNGMYYTDAYFIGKNLAEIPIFVIIPMIFVTIYYYAINFYPSFDSFLYNMLIAIMLSACGVSYGYLISCICRNTDMALSLGPPIITPLQLLGGFYVNTKTIPSFLRWAPYLSWFYYGYDLLTTNQWSKVIVLDCDTDFPDNNSTKMMLHATNEIISLMDPNDGGGGGNSPCFKSGYDVLEFLNLGVNPQWIGFVGLIMLMLCMRSSAYLMLVLFARQR